jgi:hypothetical protein
MDENFQNELASNAQQALDNQFTQSEQTDTQVEQKQVNPAAIRKSTQQSMLKAASNATGMDFQSMDDMIATIARLSQQVQSQSTQQAQTQSETPQEKQKRVQGTDLQDQIAAMKKQMEDQQANLRQKELDGSIRNAMGDRFDGDMADYTINKIKSQLVENDGDWIVVNSKNQQRYTQDGNPMSVRDLIEEVARANPKLLRQAPVQGGSGLRPQQGMYDGAPGDGEFVPDFSKDPAAFNMWASKHGLGKNSGLKSVMATVTNSTNVKRMY